MKTPTLTDKQVVDPLKISLLTTKFIDENLVAEQLYISVHTVRQHRKLGIGLPYHKFGKSVRYAQADVDALILTSRIVPANGGSDDV